MREGLPGEYKWGIQFVGRRKGKAKGKMIMEIK